MSLCVDSAVTNTCTAPQRGNIKAFPFQHSVPSLTCDPNVGALVLWNQGQALEPYPPKCGMLFRSHLYHTLPREPPCLELPRKDYQLTIYTLNTAIHQHVLCKFPSQEKNKVCLWHLSMILNRGTIEKVTLCKWIEPVIVLLFCFGVCILKLSLQILSCFLLAVSSLCSITRSFTM